MSDNLGIALLGCGTVGSAVVEILTRSDSPVASHCSKRLTIRHVLVRDPKKRRPAAVPPKTLTTDAAKIFADADTHVVVELMGGVDPARRLICEALAAGKDVVTANKALLALHGPELFAAARHAGRCIAFEAAVAGGIPIIEAIRGGLVANNIDRILGILNGTSNFILTRMLENQASYAHALAEAQRLGYAEADPTLDVRGTDAAHKLALLASLALRRRCELDRILVHGITHLELIDLVAGRDLGYVCKLLGSARVLSDGVDLRVQPTFVPRAHPLAAVAGPFNAVSVYGDAVGHTFYYGRGAGGPPTASAVVADIVNIAIGNARRSFECLNALPDQTPPMQYRDPGLMQSAFYIRLNLEDRPGGIGRVASALGAQGISIATIIQHAPTHASADGVVPVIVTTHPAPSSAVDAALAQITTAPDVQGPPVCIPVLDDED